MTVSFRKRYSNKNHLKNQDSFSDTIPLTDDNTLKLQNQRHKNLPLVSVVVPVFNADRYLEKCLQSIGKQEYSNLEIVIINDGSTDQSKEIIDRFARSDDRVVVLHKNNEGVSSARNKGIQLAKGKYIAFVDADDIIHKTYIYNLASDLIESDAVIVTTSAMNMRVSEEEFLSLAYDKCALYKEYTSTQALTALYKGTLEKGLNGQQMFLCRFIKKFELFYDTSMTICEDFDFLARAIIKANKVVLDNRDMYYYRVNETSALHTANIIQHYESLYNKQAAGRSVESKITEIVNTLNNNLLVESISCGALMHDVKASYPVEYQKILTNIGKYKYKTLYSGDICLKDRIKVLIVVICGAELGLRTIKKLNKLKGV